MVRAKERTIEYYVERLKAHLLKKFSDLEFNEERWSDKEVTLFYRPYSEDDEWAIIHRSGGIATDALVDAGYRIWVMPDSPHA